LRELVILQICYVTRAEYEYAHHVWRALDLGIAEADIAAIASESAGRKTHLGELERTAMAAARELTQDFAIADATFDRLRQWLDPARLADLVVLISTYSAINRICAGLRIDVEPDFLTYLKRFPIA
jgi:alkylhydroperoxidase family enzyme